MAEVIYRQIGLPLFQNKVYATHEEALRVQVGDVELVQCPRSGLVYNRLFDPKKLDYDEDYQNEQACTAAFRRHLESKKEEKQIFDDFVTGKGNHLAVVKIGNTGVTYKPLNRVIINYFHSNAENLAQKINRCMAMEYNNPEKKAQIYIVCSTEGVEAKWLRKAPEFFEISKIKFV